MRKSKKDKEKKAVALKYSKDDVSPIIVAKGKGYVAENIIKKGKDEKIELYEDEKLLDDLMKLEIREEIPPKLYNAVAEIIAYVYYLDKKKGDLND
ncbi:EscU/YscU/HrcU family type III secretion system export apparatus switch protein [Anaerosalibacter massiliensis]|uniref:EscU/YscU/HrcU family type III secretion system export apparatus switch protein n=1 Tax=Anaerosalibacter massiliensis TaxID=1347392 RepID=A0A9X2MD45_9FIRM|nr:EscU/YscU/HrcU family type III secretion system export apparatus switch protein [Anaerosalibacter massiliensis]MCR2042787.1 EscU/YscU/HrcU family type III secretion system export apparatus switch protein [Anaerosalibacter massiliensis]